MISAVSLDFKPNYIASVSYGTSMMGYSTPANKASTQAYSEEQDDASQLVETTSSSSNKNAITIGSGKTVQTQKVTTVASATSTASSTSTTTQTDTDSTKTIKEMATEIAATLAASAPGTAASTQINNKTNTKIAGTKAVVANAQEVESLLKSKFSSTSITFAWTKKQGKKKETTTLTLSEMQALKEIYDKSDASFSGTHGTANLISALQSKGISYAALSLESKTDIALSDERILTGGSKASSTDWIGVMVNSEEFKTAYKDALSKIKVN